MFPSSRPICEVGGTASYVPSTKSLSLGPTLVFAPALGSGGGHSFNAVSVSRYRFGIGYNFILIKTGGQ